MEFWELLGLSWDTFIQWLALAMTILSILSYVICIPWVLMTKTNSTSAVAWCLLIIFLPTVGAFLFVVFGWQHVGRPLRKKRRHKEQYRKTEKAVRGFDSIHGLPHKNAADAAVKHDRFPENLSHLALKFDAFPLTEGNRVEFYHVGQPAVDAMLAAINSARHHIHMATFILQPDETGEQFLKALIAKAKEGVQVRLLYDAMGCLRLPSAKLRELHAAGGKYRAFLPVNILRRRVQVNLRNHRKILVVDGNVGFSGGLNVGNEYICKSPRFGFWRDTHFRIEGLAVADLQRVFAEDWDFAAGEHLQDTADAQPGQSFFQPARVDGDQKVQVIESGPDQNIKSIREIYFAAVLAARRRLWIASPYFVPDDGLLDALQLAGHRGVDVRLLCLFHPDKWIPLYAARYYWPMIMNAGVRVYQYNKGMMHSKIVLVDGEWASVGSANFDNRSMYLNFEANCLFYTQSAVAELEEAFERDLHDSIRLDRDVYRRRPFSGRLLENACRLLSPVL